MIWECERERTKLYVNWIHFRCHIKSFFIYFSPNSTIFDLLHPFNWFVYWYSIGTFLLCIYGYDMIRRCELLSTMWYSIGIWAEWKNHRNHHHHQQWKKGLSAFFSSEIENYHMFVYIQSCKWMFFTSIRPYVSRDCISSDEWHLT